MRSPMLLFALLAMVGCGTRAPITKAEAARVQNVANAEAGLDALLRLNLDPVTAEIVKGARSFAAATAERIQVPAPSMTAEVIIAKPADYHKAGEAAARAAGGGSLLFWLEVAGSLALPALIAIAKNLGPLGSTFGLIADGLYSAFAPAKSKEVDAASHTVAASVHLLAGIVSPSLLATLPPEFHTALAVLAPAAEEPPP